VSQINGCAYCVDLHGREALSTGESQRRVNAVVVWREAPFFTPRERAALAWAEALTLIADSHAPDQVYADAGAAFSEEELVQLTYVIVTMNAWNRLAIAFRQRPEDK
jgi:AhpD family alkylhydroperoxidase